MRLGGRPGSIATVEAGWVPLLPGSFAAPRLTIQGVHCQVRGEEVNRPGPGRCKAWLSA